MQGFEMVNGIVFITAGLGAAFTLGLLRDQWRLPAYLLTLSTLFVLTICASQWLWAFSTMVSLAPVDIFTAGVKPPFAINLRIGLAESALLVLINLSGLLTAIYLRDTLFKQGRRAMAVLLILTMALSGIVLTRDLFNLFVFIELTVIASAGLILLSHDQRALGAGFKYLIVTQIISILLLLGIIFSYHATGTLNIDGVTAASEQLFTVAPLAFFLMLMALIIELKPFPANGWALDIYESAHPAFSAIISSAIGSVMLYALYKLLAIVGHDWNEMVSAIGIISFISANLMALSQRNDRRLLGYSSVGQMGLLVTVVSQHQILGDQLLFVVGGILLAHAVSKAGLYWLSGLIEGRELNDWSVLRQRHLLMFAFVTFIVMLIGLPPFPGFYAKWDLIHQLAGHDQALLVVLILFGAMLEAGYLFRWMGYAIKGEATHQGLNISSLKLFVVFTTLSIAWGLSYLWGELSMHTNQMHAIPLIFAMVMIVLDGLAARIKNTLAIVALVLWFVINYQSYNPLQLIFSAIILVGGAIILLASYQQTGRRMGFYPSAMWMFAGLSMLIVATDSFNFFSAWESLTIGSYFLIIRGQKSEPHALSYILFSLAGAFLILAGFAFAAAGQSQFELQALSQVTQSVAPWVFILLALGFMTKTAAVGLHIWLPGAHAEAETDVSPLVSGILLKAGLFGLMMLLMTMGKQQLYGVELTHVMMWIGAISALTGNLLAVFQEDAKRLLAYSSIGQMGYAVFGLAMMNHLGWLMALMFVINHYIYKSMLFLSVGGIAKRTGTRLMYKMGGLITLMPLSFIAVLIGIIAVSGVPPLSGFGGRWIFYNAIMSAEYRLPMIVIFLAGPIAFLYLFRLIYTIFLGQLKDEHRKLGEAPFWIILPQMIFVAFLMIVAIVPGVALRKVDGWISHYFPNEALSWEGITITSQYGYWSPVSIMIIVGVIFMTLFVWLLFVNRKAQKVKQFNIVYSAERPYRPETTHFGWNFFAPYRKAFGFLLKPYITQFWQAVTDILHGLAEMMRKLYTGNGQTYAIHLIGFVVIIFLIKGGL